MSRLIFSGTANSVLAQQIAMHLNTSLGEAVITRFADGECKVQIKDQVAGQVVCIVQPMSPPVHDNLMELCLIANALHLAGAKTIIAVVPYFAYMRQDSNVRKAGESHSAAVLASIMNACPIDQFISIDLHNHDLIELIKPPLLNLNTIKLFYQDLQTLALDKPVIVAADIGAVKRASKLADHMGTDLAFIAKRRTSTLEAMTVFGEVLGRNCVLLDDIIDSGQTICAAVAQLINFGAKKIYVYATHGLLPANAVKKLINAKCEKIMLTNTIFKEEKALPTHKFRTLSVAALIAANIEDLLNAKY